MLAVPALAHGVSSAELDGIAYRQAPGARLPLEITLRDENGAPLRLVELFDGPPLILILGYFHCPKLCSVARATLLSVLRDGGLTAGADYTFAAISIDPSEDATAAAGAKAADLAHFGPPGAERHWRFLTGEETALRRLKTAVGFDDRFDERRKAFAHPLGVVFVTPKGVVSGYLLDLGYNAEDIRRATARAASGEIVPPVSPILLLCFDFDSTTGHYSFAIVKALRWGAAATLGLLGLLAFRALQKDMRRV
ncbi:SCO family protein [Methylocystis bryophila]|uniref:SCO family protein n=1 Tax=Methylocystis bryophila TaxID=655015 RepID=UPI00131A085F|nr:SCO family protein [Methylocystis bryophila]BDV37183.1 cytochrome-c oxidase [Methylocystis bryophila]